MKMVASVACIAILIGVITGLKDVIHGNENSLNVATELGEQRSVLLDDGSVVQLNTNTSLRVNMDDAVRYVELLRGEAIFQVAKDASRPFLVDSGSIKVKAIGTKFNVYRQEAQVVVTVVEGLVAVAASKKAEQALQQINQQRLTTTQDKDPLHPEKPHESVVHLKEGNQLAVSYDGSAYKSNDVDLERVTAWTQRRLVFDNETLDAIVIEFNRYNRDRLIVVDPSLEARRITGVFNANDPDAFVVLLKSLGGIEVVKRSDGSRLLSRL